MIRPISVLRTLERRAGVNRVVLPNQKASLPRGCRLCSNLGPQDENRPRKSREALFMDPKVQNILKSITGYDVQKIFSNRPVKKYKPPKYLFLTDEELEKTRKRALREGKKALEMPPVMDPREEKTEIIETAPEWQGFNNCNLVVTDLSHGFTDRTRLIVVREPNGTLRRANWDERYRMNQIFYPVNGRCHEEPKMFQDDFYEDVLNRHEYKFFLDRACVQYEPDDPKFIFLTSKCYEHINETRKFDILRSTRHFGPLAFYLAFEQKIDYLLIDMKERGLLEDANQLIQLSHYIKSNQGTSVPRELPASTFSTPIESPLNTPSSDHSKQ